jgi:hypothetical protein
MEGPVCSSWSYKAQSAGWKKAMKAAGAVLRQRKVRAVVFVHGTFAGNDPLGILHLVESVVLKRALGEKGLWNSRLKMLSNRFFGDGGNFIPAYRKLFCYGLQNGIQCRLFSWSSVNHHAGRLLGSFRLTVYLARLRRELKLKKDEKIALVGHSHAGQLFALLSQYLTNSPYRSRLAAIGFSNTAKTRKKTTAPATRPAVHPKNTKKTGSLVSNNVLTRKVWERAVQELKRSRLELVTMGTPPRFRFASSPQFSLLHVVNHRGKGVLGGSKFSMFFSEAGDYVQQWGIAGSDALTVATDWRRQNQQLTALLGPGMDLPYLNSVIKHRMRLPNTGATLLIDYKDNQRRWFPYVQSVLGHAVYTRRRWMLWTARLLAHGWEVTKQPWKQKQKK